MRFTPEILELGNQIAEMGTPERCSGCYYPGTIGVILARRVIDGELEESQAIIDLEADLESNCPEGALKIDGVCLGNDTECRYDLPISY